MSQTDKPTLVQGSLGKTQVYSGSDAPVNGGDVDSPPPAGSLYVRHDATAAAPEGEVGVYGYVPEFTPEGQPPTPSVPAGWRLLAGGEVFNVRRFGAVGDGNADDYPAIAAALDAARKTAFNAPGNGRGSIIFFPPGIYKVSRPLDCTSFQFNLVGSGPYQTYLRGATADSGGMVIDFTGGGYSSVRDLLIDVPGDETSSTMGILIAREISAAALAHEHGADPDTDTGASVSGVNLDNVFIRLGTSTTAWGGRGTVAVYNYGGEEANYHNVFLLADTGLVLTSSNRGEWGYGVKSQYKCIIVADTSMTAVNVTGLSNLLGISGPALRLNGGASALVDAFLSTYAGTVFPNVKPYPYAIHTTATWVDFQHSGSMESFDGLLHVEGATLFGARLYSYMGRGNYPAIKLTGPGAALQGCELNISPNAPVMGQANCLVSDVDPDHKAPEGNAHYVLSCRVMLRNQKIDLQGKDSQVLASVIQTEVTLADALVNIKADGGSKGNVITATDSAQIG
jgi:hypothetical protein